MLDLSQDGGQAADLAAIATWPNPADDYDLVLATPQGFGGSQAAQPAAPSFEAAEARGLRHCDLLHVDVLTRNAVSPGAVQLQLAVTPLAPGEPAPSGPGSPAGPSPATPTGSGPPAPRATRRRPKLSVRRIRRARGRYSVALRATARLTRIRTSVFRVRKGGRRVLVGRRALRRPLGPRSRRVRLPLARPAGGARYVVVVRGTAGSTTVRRRAGFRVPSGL